METSLRRELWERAPCDPLGLGRTARTAAGQIDAIRKVMRKEMRRIDSLYKLGQLSEWEVLDEAHELVASVDHSLEPKQQMLDQGLGQLAVEIARIDRYERRVLTRRRRAIDDYDAIVDAGERMGRKPVAG